MSRVIAALLAMMPLAAFGQATKPMMAQCFPALPLIEMARSGALEMRKVYTDGQGDDWIIVTRKADGASMMGWLIIDEDLFCAVAGATRKPEDGPLPKDI